MHAWLCENPVGVDGLQWQEMPTPQPQAGQVLVQIKASSLNFPDLLIVQNKYQFKPPLPFVPGSEFSGVVDAVGDGVRHLKVGDRVASIGVTGGFATHACVAAAQALALPPTIDLGDAAAFAFTYGTSAHALLDRSPSPTELEIREELSGNICRCTGYGRIIDAVQRVSVARRGEG